MLKLRNLMLSVMSLSLMGAALLPALAQDGPKVVKRSLVFNVEDLERHWPDPNKDAFVGKPTWVPQNDSVRFVVEGPVPEGGKFSIAFTRPGGKAWINLDCFGPDSLEAGEVADVSCNTIQEKMATPESGSYGVKINYAKGGSSSELFKGSFKVGTYTNPDSKKPNFYINEDWRVPLGYVTVDAASSPGSPTLYAYFWFKHRNINHENLVAELVQNGQVVALSTFESNSAENINDRKLHVSPTDPKLNYSYQLWKFTFASVHSLLDDPESYNTEGWHTLAEHPGQYEIRVKHKGELVRTASFSVGGDGTISAPGSAEKDSNGNTRILVPVKVSGKLDYAWDQAAYKTDVYYGNPAAELLSVIAP